MTSVISAIGNPRGNENAFLLTMGIFWFRVHNWWAGRLQRAYDGQNRSEEFLFNRARQFTIATYQVRFYNASLLLYSSSSGWLNLLCQFVF